MRTSLDGDIGRSLFGQSKSSQLSSGVVAPEHDVSHRTGGSTCEAMPVENVWHTTVLVDPVVWFTHVWWRLPCER